MKKSVLFSFVLSSFQISPSFAAPECSDTGMTSFFKSRGFERTGADVKSMDFNMKIFQDSFETARKVAEKNPEYQKVRREIEEKLKVSTDFEAGLNNYIDKKNKLENLRFQYRDIEPSSKNGYKADSKLGTLKKEIDQAAQQVADLRNKLGKDAKFLSEVNIECYLSDSKAISQSKPSQDLGSTLKSARYLLEMPDIGSIDRLPRHLRGKQDWRAEGSSKNYGRTPTENELKAEKFCREYEAAKFRQNSLIRDASLSLKNEIKDKFAQFKDGDHFLSYLDFQMQYPTVDTDSLQRVTNTKGETAWIFTKQGKIVSTIISNDLGNNTRRYQTITLDDQTCKLNYQVAKITKTNGGGSTYHHGVKVNEAICAVVDRFKDDPMAWNFINGTDPLKETAECTRQGGRYFGSAVAGKCECPNRQQIYPQSETCLKERFVESSDKFFEQLSKVSPGVGYFFNPSNRQETVEICKEQFSQAMSSTSPSPSKPNSSGVAK